MFESGKDIERLITKILAPEGFHKKGRTWRLDTPETIAVVNLQRSQWSEKFYLNLGVMVKSMDSKLEPKHYECHARRRLAEIMPSRLRGHALFDLCDPSILPEEREKEITAAINDIALPLLRKCKTFAGLSAAIHEDPLFGHSGELRKLIGIP